jgi:hypothetical protein
MSALTCVRARLRLQERGAGLSAADALRLEDHLDSCDDCREQAVLLDNLRGLAARLDGRLAPPARERAITGAFAHVARRSLRAPSARPLQLAWGVAAFAAGAALFFALRTNEAAHTIGPNAGPIAAAPHSAPSWDARVISGALEIDGAAQQRGAILTAGRSLYTHDGAELALGHAQVSLRPQTRVRWNAEPHVLELEAGSVLVEVDPSRHQRFSVQTPHFSAIVLGTRFEVTLEGVRVERGKVQVVARDGRVLAPGLTAGQSFSLASEQAALEESAAPADPSEATRERSARNPSALKLGAGEWLQRARVSLAERDPRSARRAVDAALALRPVQAVRAEALSLRAECARVDGDDRAAVRQYLQVANDFGRLAAAQNALFAAARLEAERGRHDHAAELFARYLARYPHGSLADDAARRLQALGAKVQPRDASGR